MEKPKAAPWRPDRKQPRSQVERLRQFLRLNIPVNLFFAAGLFLLWRVVPFWAIGVMAFLVLGEVGAVLVALWLVNRNRIEAAVLTAGASALVMVVAGMLLSGGLALPILELLAVLVVMSALPFLKKRPLLMLMILTTASGVALSLLSLHGDFVGLDAMVPAWIPVLANGICVPIYIGFTCLLVWQYASNLGETVTQLQDANSALRTSERLLEEKVQQRTSELARKNEELLKLDEMKTRFISTASHELRSPLTSIRAFSEMLASDPALSELHRDFAVSINVESERLSRLASQLVDLSQMELGVIQWTPRALDLASELRDLAAARQNAAEAIGLRLRLELPETLPRAMADQDGLRQVLVNLVDNAFKFSSAGGQVTLSAAASAGGVSVFIRDSGPGIDPEDQKRIFDRFYQAGDLLTEKPQGAGLGLAICREILLQHGSELRVQSELGKGSCFSFELPAAPSVASSPVQPEPVAAGR